jgi:hypothetical protein
MASHNHGDGSNLSSHILPNAATMLGVCMTTIGLVKLFEAANRVAVVTDKLLAVNSLLFVASAILSYASIRSRRNAQRLERIADIAFITGLVSLAVIGILFAFEFT